MDGSPESRLDAACDRALDAFVAEYVAEHGLSGSVGERAALAAAEALAVADTTPHAARGPMAAAVARRRVC